MEPLSVIASITGILAAGSKITLAVTGFIEKEKDAPASAQSVVTEVADLSLCLERLTPFITGTRIAGRTRQDAISVEQVVIISTSLVMNISELEQLLDSFKIDQSMTRMARVRWVRNEEKINRLLTRIQASKVSLNLILTIFTCISTDIAQTSIASLATAVDRILRTNEDISQRIAGIETHFASSIVRSASTLSTPLLDHNVSDETHSSEAFETGREDIRPVSGLSNQSHFLSAEGLANERNARKPLDIANSDSQILQFHPATQAELSKSRVYLRTKHRRSMRSLYSRHESVAGASFFPGVSLAEISNLSVISLPIFRNELWNPQQYRNVEHHDSNGASILHDSKTPSKLSSLVFRRLKVVWPLAKGADAKRTDEELRRVTIDPIVAEDRTRGTHTTKVLMLGACMAGKTTVVKQMRLLFADGFTVQERADCRLIILTNILTAIRVIIKRMEKKGCNLDLDSKSRIWSLNTLPEAHHLNVYLGAIHAISANEEFQKIVVDGSQHFLRDKFQYYMRQIDQVFAPDYLPNDEDIMRASSHTTGVSKITFAHEGESFRIVDIGRCRPEQSNWIYASEGDHGLIFVAALSGYNECLVEDKTSNRMKESLTLFESLMNLSWFKKSAVNLLLTTKDIFEEKLSRIPIKKHFPDYDGPENDSLAGQQFFIEKFLSLNRDQNRKIEVYDTNAMDSETMDQILRKVMRSAVLKRKEWI